MIPELATETTLRTFQKTREGMIKLANQVAAVKPSTIVIAAPHGLRLWKNIGIVTSENSSGRLQLSRRSKRVVHVRVKCNQEFAEALLDNARKRKLPVVGANYGSAEGATSDMPMDWGTFVPLWFILKRCRRKPDVVIVTPSREIPLSKNYGFGQIIAELAGEKSKEKTVFVASADQAHAPRNQDPTVSIRQRQSMINL